MWEATHFGGAGARALFSILTLQLDALTKEGCERICQEKTPAHGGTEQPKVSFLHTLSQSVEETFSSKRANGSAGTVQEGAAAVVWRHATSNNASHSLTTLAIRILTCYSLNLLSAEFPHRFINLHFPIWTQAIR